MLNSIIKKIKEEKDLKTFTYKNYQLAIIRQQTLGHLCGYVQIPKEHPFYQKEITEINQLCHEPIPAHGGLNITRYNPEDESYWIGFDCGHSGDLSPYLEQLLKNVNPETFELNPNRHYRDMNYVKENLIEVVDAIEANCQYQIKE